MFYRPRGIALLMFCMRIGTASSPWIVLRLAHIHTTVPFIIIGIMSIVSGLLCCKLKETLGEETRETMEEYS